MRAKIVFNIMDMQYQNVVSQTGACFPELLSMDAQINNSCMDRRIRGTEVQIPVSDLSGGSKILNTKMPDKG